MNYSRRAILANVLTAAKPILAGVVTAAFTALGCLFFEVSVVGVIFSSALLGYTAYKWQQQNELIRLSRANSIAAEQAINQITNLPPEQLQQLFFSDPFFNRTPRANSENRNVSPHPPKTNVQSVEKTGNKSPRIFSPPVAAVPVEQDAINPAKTNSP